MYSKMILYASAIVVTLTIVNQSCEGADFRDVYKAAVQLEGTGKLLTGQSIDSDPNLLNVERRIAKQFIKPPKSDLVDKHMLRVASMINEIKSKTISILHTMMSKEGFGGFKRFFFLSNIKNYATFDPEVTQYANGLNWKIDQNSLSEQEINCAILNLNSKHHQVVLFVLKTDLKHLVLNEIGLINEAILSQLKDQKFLSRTDYFNNNNVNGDQIEALKKFYEIHRDPKVTRAEDYLDHVMNPGQLIIGRLMDSCQVVIPRYEQWLSIIEAQNACPAEVTIFKTSFVTPEQAKEMYDFCKVFVQV